MKIKEVIHGTDGNDILIGEDGSQIIIGAEGNDTLSGGDGDDKLIGGDGNDELFGNAGDDMLIGGDGEDIGTGGSGSDVFLAGSGNDTGVYDFSINSGFDSLDYYNGGSNDAGGDTFRLVISDADLLALGIGEGANDEEKIADAKDQIEFLFNSNVGGLIDFTVLGINIVIRNFEKIDISSGGEDIIGTPGDDVLIGTPGDDTISPIAGNDIVDGGAGFDTLNYADDINGITTDLAAGKAIGTGIDTSFTNMEGFVYGSGNDTFINNAAIAHTVNLGGGNNILEIRGSGGTTFLEDGGGSNKLVMQSTLNPTFELDFENNIYSFNPDVQDFQKTIQGIEIVHDGSGVTNVKSFSPSVGRIVPVKGQGHMRFDELTQAAQVEDGGGDVRVSSIGGGGIEAEGYTTFALTDFADTIKINNAAMGSFHGRTFDMALNVALIEASLVTPADFVDASSATANLTWVRSLNTLTDGLNTVIINNAEEFAFGSGNDNYINNAAGTTTVNLGTGNNTLTLRDAGGPTLLKGSSASNTLVMESTAPTTIFELDFADGIYGFNPDVQDFQKTIQGIEIVHGGSGVTNVKSSPGLGDLVPITGSGSIMFNELTHAVEVDAGSLLVSAPGQGTLDLDGFSSITFTDFADTINIDNIAMADFNGLTFDMGLGIDLIDASLATVDLSSNLITGELTDTTNTVTINNAENVTMGSGNDVVTGNTFDNTIEGGAGADTLDGGGGTNTLSYALDETGVVVDLSTNIVSGGHATGDTVSNFENVIGGSGFDILVGDGDVNVIKGGAGDDTIEGREGADILDGGAGAADGVGYFNSAVGVTVSLETNTASDGDQLSNFENLFGSFLADILTGDDDDNTIFGLGGNDIIEGGGGADRLVAGFGDPNDTVSYASDTSVGVTVDLTTTSPQSSVGDAEGDALLWFENIIGGSGNDTLTGDGNANTIEGRNGNDTLDGGAGLDTFVFLSTDTGADILNSFIQTEDQLDFRTYELTDINDLSIFINGENSEVSVGADLVVTVTGVIGLVEGDFIFV